jgi:uncharacterized protein YjbI with pentapeptide repeats
LNNTNYILNTDFKGIVYSENEISYKEYENCSFIDCNFTSCIFLAASFIDCKFVNCNFNGAKINHTSFRTVYFNKCKISDVNFAMIDKFIFEIHFKDCILDFSKFYALKLKGTSFTNTSLVAVDFMAADLSEVVFENCDLYRSEFDKANATKTNFKTSFNYTINPESTKIKKAIFSLEGVKGLLYKYDIIVK